MQRLKDEGMDPSKPVFSRLPSTSKSSNIQVPMIKESMTKPDISRKITADELEAYTREGGAWFVVKGEVRPTSLTRGFYLRLRNIF